MVKQLFIISPFSALASVHSSEPLLRDAVLPVGVEIFMRTVTGSLSIVGSVVGSDEQQHRASDAMSETIKSDIFFIFYIIISSSYMRLFHLLTCRFTMSFPPSL